MTTIFNGVLGGVIVEFLATAATRFVGDWPGLGPEHRAVSGGNQFVGSPWMLGVPPTLAEVLGVALGWCALVFRAVFILWRVGSGATVSRSRRARLLVYQLVYGLGFGAWIRLTWIT